MQSTCSLSTCERTRPHGSLMWGYQCLPNGVSKSGRNQCWDDSGRWFTKSTLWVNGRRGDRDKSGLADTFTASNRIDSREMTYVSLSLKKGSRALVAATAAIRRGFFCSCLLPTSQQSALLCTQSFLATPVKREVSFPHTGWCLREIPGP